MTARSTCLVVLVAFALPLSMFAQTKKPISKKGLPAVKKSLGCRSGTFAFKCPKDYKVLLSGMGTDRLFFANNPTYKYGVFAVFQPSDTAMSDALPKILKVFLPKSSQQFEWKDVEADPRKSSKYEVESKRRIAIDKPISSYVTLEYRLIEYNGKRLLSGTVVDGYLGPIGIRESFDEGTHTTNGGCFDSVDIIATLTKEKVDEEMGPCFFTITMSPGN